LSAQRRRENPLEDVTKIYTRQTIKCWKVKIKPA
jgi:hypothetical protein